MEAPPPAWILPLCQWGAFWVAVLAFRGESPVRFVLGLGLGAVFARLGWALLHFSRILPDAFGPGWPDALTLAVWLAQEGGFSVLFVPLGLLLLIPWRQGSRARQRYAASACRALAPGLAVARLGCLWAGCCSGQTLGGEPAAGFVHPTPLYELLVWVLATAGLGRVQPGRVPGIFAMVFGGLRWVTEPLRAPPPLGTPELDPACIGLVWFWSGLCAMASGTRAERDTLGGDVRL